MKIFQETLVLTIWKQRDALIYLTKTTTATTNQVPNVKSNNPREYN